MGEEKSGVQSGNFSFGNIGGDVSVTQAGADVVGGDKVTTTTTTTTTTITYGFKQEEDKAEFVKQIEELRSMLRKITSAFDDVEELDEDQKDEVTMEVLQQVKDLKEVKKKAEETPVGKEAPKEKAKLVGEYLDKTTTLMEKLKKMGEATAAATEQIVPYIVKALPLIASARHLFGLP